MITDIRAYSALDTANLPRILVRTDSNVIVLDTGDTVTTLGGNSQGVFFIPFRPGASPDPWMYIAAAEDYRKVSAPDATDAVTAYKTGIAEPLAPPEAITLALGGTFFSSASGDWTNGGTAGAPSNSDITTDTVGDLIQDPVGIPDTTLWSLEVSSTQFYQAYQVLEIGAVVCAVQDVIPAINSGAPFTIDDIYYYMGSSGLCVITPHQSAVSVNIPSDVAGVPLTNSFITDPVIAGLRRGALLTLTNSYTYADETVLVLSVTKGPNGLLSFECETVGTYSAGDTIEALPTILVNHFAINSGTTGDAIVSEVVDSTLTGAGIGTLSHALSVSPFTQLLDFPTDATPQLDDYINVIIQVSDPALLTRGRLIFNVGVSVDYNTDVYYMEFTSDDLIRTLAPIPPLNPSTVLTNTDTTIPTLEQFIEANTGGFTGFGPLDEANRQQLTNIYNQLYANISSPTGIGTDDALYPDSNYVLLQLPIRSLIRAGSNQNRTLADCNGVRVEFLSTGTVDVSIGSLWIMGSGQVDAGRLGSPYFYTARGRSSTTGAVSNPSPASRYGVFPRRQRVEVAMVDLVNDPQMDTWDVYRYGGTLTSWRYVGSTPNTGGGTDYFIDNIFDTSLAAASSLDRDNFEPWPTIGLPFDLGASTATIHGTVLLITFASSADIPSTLTRWLPGTLLLVNGVAYTLWTRPSLVSSLVYMLQTLECMGADTVTTVEVREPIVGNQTNLSVFGPDASGTVFGCGDLFRPGTLSYSKSYNPDSVPDSYNREIVQPSEPLIGGVVIDGLASVASSSRWWDLYPQFGNTAIGAERYQPVERGVGRGLAAPYGFCTDSRVIYFVAKDGIWVKEGASGRSLTEPWLRNLFPHEGVQGRDILYAGQTIFAPDYTRTQTFRLAYCKGYLYFDYEDSTATRRTLVCDTTKEAPAWSVDDYADPITVHYAIEGPENDTSTVSSIYPILLMADSDDNVHVQRDLSNDNGVPITCNLATFEWNGGDVRADQFWGDGMVDAMILSPGGMDATPISDRISSGPATSIDPSPTRQRAVINSAGIEQKTLGYLFTWTDDFDYIYDVDEPTTLYAWQPLYQAVPLRIFTWQTQATSFGFHGYMHLMQVLAAYRSSADVLLTITTYDGTDPVTITLPSTSDTEAKILFPFSFNKGLLYTFRGESDLPWYPYFDAWEFYVGVWGRTGPYEIRTDVEAPKGLGRSIDE